MPEIIKKLENFVGKPLQSFDSAQDMFDYATEHVMNFRSQEFFLCWSSIRLAAEEPVTEFKFFKEYLWCVYVSGFSAATISKKYDSLLLAHNIVDAKGAYRPVETDFCVAELDDIYAVFKNCNKAFSVIATRGLVKGVSWNAFKKKFIDPRDPKVLDELPGIGPALSVHLARNLGNMELVKPDVHLSRLAEKYGFKDVPSMCKAVSPEPLAKTDLILWLASVDNGTKKTS